MHIEMPHEGTVNTKVLLFFFSPEGGVGLVPQAWMPTYVSILCSPQMIWASRAMVEWYIDGKTKEFREKPVPVPLCPPQILHRLTWAWTRASAMRGRRLTTWAMAWPKVLVLLKTAHKRVSKQAAWWTNELWNKTEGPQTDSSDYCYNSGLNFLVSKDEFFYLEDCNTL
jgi:hypothetical protein